MKLATRMVMVMSNEVVLCVMLGNEGCDVGDENGNANVK